MPTAWICRPTLTAAIATAWPFPAPAWAASPTPGPSPTPAQLTSLCAEAAAIARNWGWREDEISIQSVMTHAEAASNRDGRVMHDNYGPMIWGGTGERWDLLWL